MAADDQTTERLRAEVPSRLSFTVKKEKGNAIPQGKTVIYVSASICSKFIGDHNMTIFAWKR